MGKKIITKSADETEKIGEEFAAGLKAGDIVCLYGNLGSGKTTFVKGVAIGLGITSRIISPTFVIVRKHEIGIKYKVRLGSPVSTSTRGGPKARQVLSINPDQIGIKYIYHIDLYRLKNEDDVRGIDLKEILGNKNSVALIEWPEKAEGLLPKKRFDIKFDYVDYNTRKIELLKH